MSRSTRAHDPSQLPQERNGIEIKMLDRFPTDHAVKTSRSEGQPVPGRAPLTKHPEKIGGVRLDPIPSINGIQFPELKTLAVQRCHFSRDGGLPKKRQEGEAR